MDRRKASGYDRYPKGYFLFAVTKNTSEEILLDLDGLDRCSDGVRALLRKALAFAPPPHRGGGWEGVKVFVEISACCD